jgi:hypothetical protein
VAAAEYLRLRRARPLRSASSLKRTGDGPQDVLTLLTSSPQRAHDAHAEEARAARPQPAAAAAARPHGHAGGAGAAAEPVPRRRSSAAAAAPRARRAAPRRDCCGGAEPWASVAQARGAFPVCPFVLRLRLARRSMRDDRFLTAILPAAAVPTRATLPAVSPQAWSAALAAAARLSPRPGGAHEPRCAALRPCGARRPPHTHTRPPPSWRLRSFYF